MNGLKFNIIDLILSSSEGGFCSSIQIFSSRALRSEALATVADVSGTCLISVNKIWLDLFTGPEMTGAE